LSSILLVDDDEDIVLFLREMLEEDGHRVETSLTGRGALDKARSGKFDIMLLDYILPDMSGDQVVDELKRMGCRAAIYYLTGKRLTREEVEKGGAVRGVLVKPVTYEAMMAIVNVPPDAPTADYADSRVVTS